MTFFFIFVIYSFFLFSAHHCLHCDSQRSTVNQTASVDIEISSVKTIGASEVGALFYDFVRCLKPGLYLTLTVHTHDGCQVHTVFVWSADLRTSSWNCTCSQDALPTKMVSSAAILTTKKMKVLRRHLWRTSRFIWSSIFTVGAAAVYFAFVPYVKCWPP